MSPEVKESLDRLAELLISKFNQVEGPIMELDMSKVWDSPTFNAITENAEMMSYVNKRLGEEGLIVGKDAFGSQTLSIADREFVENNGDNESVTLEEFAKLAEQCGSEEAARSVLVEMALNKKRQ